MFDPTPLLAAPISTGDADADALLAKLALGGPIVVIQIILSIIGTAIALERLVAVRRSAVVPRGLAAAVLRLWPAKEDSQLRARCAGDGSVLARVVELLIAHRSRPAAELLDLSQEVARPIVRRHLQRAYAVVVIATIEPMLGLLGTVVGMIGAFDKVAAEGALGNPSFLANEISLALITTAVGLAIAVPLLLVYHLIKGRLAALSTEMESVVVRAVAGVSSAEA